MNKVKIYRKYVRQLTIIATLFLVVCEGKEESDKELDDTENVYSESKTKNTLIVEKNTVTKDKEIIRLHLRIYEADALGLGEFYTSSKQLNEAKLICDFTVLKDKGVKGTIADEQQGYWLEYEETSHEPKSVVFLELEAKYKSIQFSLSSLVNLSEELLMEHSKIEGSSKMNVFCVSVDKLEEGSKGEK